MITGGLGMRMRCERCGGELSPDGEGYICSYECTYCPSCYEIIERRCLNCGGELVRRPKRTVDEACSITPDAVA